MSMPGFRRVGIFGRSTSDFRPEHFIPHDLPVNGLDDDTPILISHEVEPTAHQDVLVNMASFVPDFFSRFTRVAEVVPLDENSRQAARVSYKFYQDVATPWITTNST